MVPSQQFEAGASTPVSTAESFDMGVNASVSFHN